MRVLVLLLVLVAAASVAVAQQNIPVARWGIPSFEDEACVLCQYSVERVQNALVQRLDQLDKTQGKQNGAPSTADPFAAGGATSVLNGFGKSVAEAAGVPAAVGSPATGMLDLSFEPSLAYKKELMRSLRSRWGGSSILRYIWEDYLTNFCAQDRLPGLYVPVCSMMYENAKKIMKLIFYGYPTDQVCLKSQMCGKQSYFAAPTAVHQPVMSIYWNNKRGLDGFEGGIHGITASDIKQKLIEKEQQAKEARELRKKRAQEAKNKLEAAEKLAEMQAARALEDAKRALAQSELARREAERAKYDMQVEKTRAEVEARKRAETEAREALAREANVRMTNLLPLSRLHAEITGGMYRVTDPSQSVTTAQQVAVDQNQKAAQSNTKADPIQPNVNPVNPAVDPANPVNPVDPVNPAVNPTVDPANNNGGGNPTPNNNGGGNSNSNAGIPSGGSAVADMQDLPGLGNF